MTCDLKKLGSETAKNGFKNEDTVIKKFNDWKTDEDSQKWLELMNYSLTKIKKVDAVKLHGFKTDVQVKVTIHLKEAIHAENISVKLVSNPKGFNQIDKRWVNKYAELWDIPKDIICLLKLFTGEIKSKRPGLKDKRRMLLTEMDSAEQVKISEFFTKNKILIIADILQGRGMFSAGWMLVALKDSTSIDNWTVKSMNHVMNYFGNEEVKITERGSLKIGRITMQRKGGDDGRKSANMLQFKINPAELFENHA
jgi:hypothetical protein